VVVVVVVVVQVVLFVVLFVVVYRGQVMGHNAGRTDVRVSGGALISDARDDVAMPKSGDLK